MDTEDALTQPDSASVGNAEPVAQLPPPTVATVPTRKRPRIALGTETTESGRAAKRGKSMFGVLLGTLNKAKIEDKERNASDAAKKRALIEQRLQTKLAQETSSVRKAEEAKRDRHAASRKEEEIALKDSMMRTRRTRLPHLANFLLTSDVIPSSLADDSNNTTDPQADLPEHDKPSDASKPILNQPPRSHPPPLFYLPALLTPAQAALVTQRKKEVERAASSEWSAWTLERTKGIEEARVLRTKAEASRAAAPSVTSDVRMEEEPASSKPTADLPVVATENQPEEVPAAEKQKEDEPMEEDGATGPGRGEGDGGHDDDAVEY